MMLTTHNQKREDSACIFFLIYTPKGVTCLNVKDGRRAK